MSSGADVKIIVTLQDNGSRNLLQQLGLIDSATDKVNASAAKAGSAFSAMNQKAAQGGNAMKSAAQGVDQVANKAKGVTRELDNWISKTKTWGSMGAQAVAGWTAAKMAGNALVQKPVDYDARAQEVANTAAHEKDASGKIAEKINVKAAVDVALKTANGGTQDDALGLLDKMIAGGMAKDEAYKALPDMLKGQIASGMDGG